MMDLGQVFTNGTVASYMVSMLGLGKDALILDPCFGAGAFLQACKRQGFANVHGYEIDQGLYENGKKQFPQFCLYHGDFLKAPDTKKYDGIVMNPPYIRQEKINDLKIYGITKAELQKNEIYKPLPSTANMYMYFIFKALDLLGAGGELIVIFPCSFMGARGGKAFWKALNSRASLIKQVHISGEVFEKSALVEVVILKLKKGIVEEKSEVIYLEVRADGISEVAKKMRDKELDFKIPFAEYAAVRRGLTTGCNAMYINPKFRQKASGSCLVPILSSPKAVVGYGTKNADFDCLLHVPEDGEMPGEVKRYLKKWKEEIIKEKAPKTLYQKIQEEENWYKLPNVDGRGIIFSYFVRNDMKFVMNDSEVLVRDNFYIIKPKIDSYIMLSLLNNYFTYYQLEKRGKNYGAGLLKLQRYDVEALKFPDIKLFSKEDNAELVRLAMDLVYNGDKNNIAEITKIISKYTTGDFAEMIALYERTKRFRLEGREG